MDEHQARALAAGLRAGDADAWRKLYDAYAEQVWRVAARLAGPNAADVADVVQETMLAAARSARSFDEAKGSLWNWLYGIARTQVALHYRKQGRHDVLKRLREGRWEPPPEGFEDGGTVQAELAESVRAALRELPDEYETLLTAKYLDGDPVERIAVRQRCTETAVRSKLARAREAFRRIFTRAADGAVCEKEVCNEAR